MTKFIPTPQIAKMSSVLYSATQDCFHLERVEDTIKTNLKYALVTENKSDYHLIGIFENDIEADKYIEILKNKFKEIKSNYK